MTIEDDSKIKEIIRELSPVSKISVHPKKAIVCLVGMGIYKRRGVAGEVFATLGAADISLDQISQGASEINITFVVDEKDADKAVAILHKKFFENGKNELFFFSRSSDFSSARSARPRGSAARFFSSRFCSRRASPKMSRSGLLS